MPVPAEPEATDWAGIVQLYGALERMQPSPVVTLNRAAAMSKTDGADAALDLIAPLEPALSHYFHFHGLRGNLLMQLGRTREAAPPSIGRSRWQAPPPKRPISAPISIDYRPIDLNARNMLRLRIANGIAWGERGASARTSTATDTGTSQIIDADDGGADQIDLRRIDRQSRRMV